MKAIVLLYLLMISQVLAQDFDVTIISEKHDLIDHEVIFKVKNLDVVDKQFLPRIVIENINFNEDKIMDFHIYEYKPKLKGIKGIERRFVQKTCFNNFTDNSTDEKTSYDCSDYEYFEEKIPKLVNDWVGEKINKKYDMLSRKSEFEYKTTTIKSKNSGCSYDDLNNEYDCFGEKIFKITWKTPITKNTNGFGSRGYYSIEDKLTGVNYDPWWNVNWQYRRLLTIKNNENSFIFNMSINFTLNTQTLISQGKMKSDCSDIRIVANNNSYMFDIALDNCNSANTFVYFKDSFTSGEEKTFYIYYGNPSASNLIKTKCEAYYALCEDFENGYNDLFDLHPYDTNGGWELYNLGGSYGYVVRRINSCSTTYCKGSLISKEKVASKVFRITFDKNVIGNCGDYSNFGQTDQKGNYDYETKPNTFALNMNNGAGSNLRIANITSSINYFLTNVTVGSSWNKYIMIKNTTHIKAFINNLGTNVYYIPDANASPSINQYILLYHLQTSSCNGYLDNVFVENIGFLGNSFNIDQEEPQPTTTTTTTPTTTTTINPGSGLEFNDIFNIFKTGFVDGIAGNWLIAGLILTGVSLWLGLSLGLSIDSLLVLSIPIILTMVFSYILSSSVTIIIGLILALLIYIIYTRLFKR